MSTYDQLPDSLSALGDHRALDRAPADAFTPILFLGGMIGRSTGANATQALWGSLAGEVVLNALAHHYAEDLGPRYRTETGANIFVDVAAGFLGWLLMDAILEKG